MSILFFTKGDKRVASSRQRVWLLAEHLKNGYGYKYEVMHSIHYAFWDISTRRVHIVRDVYRQLSANDYSLMFVHKSFFPWDIVLLMLCAKWFKGKKLIYDLDDAEWVHSPVKSWVLARCADHVFCGSHVIWEWAKHINPSATLVSTVLDASLYKKHAVVHAPRELYTIGWTGTGMHHFRDGLFGIIKQPLEDLARVGVRFRFVIFGAQSYQPLKDYFKDVPFETVFIDQLDWADPEAVPKAIEQYQFDVGVMPQNDSAFNRAKCAFKAIEYMACGVPVVASSVGENVHLIQPGINGYLASTSSEWQETLYKLLADPNLRKEMGEHALGTVRARYSYQSIVSTIAMTIDEAR